MSRTTKDMEREIMVSHQSDLLTQDLILTGIFKHCRFKEYGLSFDFPFIMYEHGSGDISYTKWQVEELKKLDLSKQQFEKLVVFLEKELLNYKSFLKGFEKTMDSSVNKEKKIKEFFKASLIAVATIPYFAFELSLSKKLKKEGINFRDIPSSATDTSVASLELEKIAKEHKNELEKANKGSNLKISKSLEEKLKAFCDRYGYLGMIYFKGESWKIPDAYKMLLTVQEKKQVKQVGGKKNLKSSIFLGFASKLLRLRTLKWETLCYGCFLFKEYIKKYFAGVIVYPELLNLRVNEVLNLIERKLPARDKVLGRDFFILEIKDDGVFLSTEKKEAVKTKGIVLEGALKGQIAYSGKVVGRAKIILSSKDCEKVEVNDILVTKMSTPDFLPAMRRAAGFVTDIGGITSHAAIVSRELGKPCIIGTKVATKVLKDGDTIEVDANKGIVRKIK